MKISLFNKLVIFCATLLGLRFFITNHYTFLFLFWNLFLAWLPLFVIRRAKSGDSLFRKHVLILLAILFLPNAPYILTDLIHLTDKLHAPFWLDLTIILSFAFLGLFYFLIASEKILQNISAIYGSRHFNLTKVLLIGASGYGIYLGRYLRFNSWDIVSNPVGLAKGMYSSVFDPAKTTETLAITLVFSVFLYLIFEIYLSFKTKAAGNELH